MANTSSIEWLNVYQDPEEKALFCGVTSNPFYCVYVTDDRNHKIWVFTHELSELLYTYGEEGLGEGQFVSPREICIIGDEVAITEDWTATTGIQYFKIIPEIREFYPQPGIFDATGDSVKINFRVDETANYLTMNVAGRNLFENQYFVPGRYSVYWDGRNVNGKVVLPGNYLIRISCQGQVIATTSVKVKGTLKSGTLAQNEHWTEAGEPYVLTGDVEMPNQLNSKLVIDPGVKVMPTGNYGIYPPVYHSGGSTLLAQGSAINKILFTPHRKLYPIPDSVSKGFWKGITRRWVGSDRSFERLVFDHCIIEAAGSDSGAIWASPRTKYVSITNTEISKSGGYGLYCDYFRCDTVLVNNCQFTDNDSMPIIVPFKFIGEIYGNSFVNNKPDVIAIVGETRKTDAVIYNQGVPYWFLKGQTWECKIEGTSTYCPTLVIQPGVKILFSDSCGLYALSRSKIIAIGKPDSIITFTALDTTRHWRGIHINNSHPADTSRFEYCEISYGGRFLIFPLDAGRGNLALFNNQGAFVLKNSRIARSMSYGVGDAHNFETDTCLSLVQDNIFYANDSFPLIVSTTEFGECKGNQFIDNQRQGILIRGGGDITRPTTIRNQGVPYVIDCWFVVNSRLNIDDGCILKSKNRDWWFKPNGVLRAKGATFTAYDTLWYGMKFDNSRSDTSILDSCIIEKAKAVGGSWPWGAVHISNSWVRISNSAIMNNERGIYMNGAASRLTLTNNLISQNVLGIGDYNDINADSLCIKFNEFLGNRCAFATAYIYPYLKADSNWWGDETGPWDPSSGAPDYNPSGRGDSIGDYVIYRPWLTSPVQPPKVTLIQPNGGEVLYCGQEYEIVWNRAIGGKRGQLEAIKGNKSEIRNTKYETDSNNQTLNRILIPFGKWGYRGIIRQELYYTTDFPEGGKAEAFWRFIDTVPVGETSYVWHVPNIPSKRCRIGIKIYYETERQGDQEKGIRVSGNQDIRIKTQITNPKSQIISNNQISNIKITAILSHSGRDLTFDFPLLTSDGCAIGVDISDGNFTIALASDFALSTAYNQGKKILTSPTGNKVHFVYTNEGLTLPSGIFYCYSRDSGKTFEFPERVDSSGLYPAMSLDPYGNPCASWVSGSGIYFTYWTSSWAPPDTIVLPVENVSPPSMVCDNKDTVHLVYVQYYQLPSDTGDLVYLKFKRTDFEGAVKETLQYHIFCRTPSLALDELRNIHILWQGEKCICYQRKDQTGWSGVDTIYTTTTNERLYPVIDVYGNKVVAVWQDRDISGNLEIFSRRKIDTGWEGIKKVTHTLGDSKFPVLAKANYCLWQDNTEGNWEVYKSEYVDTAGTWLEPENLSNTLTQSTFPHCAYALVNANTAKLHILWTEGDTIPYPIEFKKLDVLPVAKVFVDVGQSMQSSYCLHRDGYWVFGERPYQTTDWGYENVRYKISGLDPQRDYRLDLAYYFENNPRNNADIGAEEAEGSSICRGRLQSDEIIRPSGETLKQVQGDIVQGMVQNDKYEPERPDKPERPDRPEKLNRPEGIGRIIQALVVDGIGLDTAFITPNHLKRISVFLPELIYEDGEIILEIKRIKGKRVVLSEIGLYEFPEEEKDNMVSGPQGGEAQISRPFYFERIYPNPFKDHLVIKFQIPGTKSQTNSQSEIPNKSEISLKIYDATGRLVKNLSLQPSSFISHNSSFIIHNSVVWDGTDDLGRELPSGVYFVRLETDDFKGTEKVILLR